MEKVIHYIEPSVSWIRRTNSDSFIPLTIERAFQPADPLPKRKVLPLKSPRFGHTKEYIPLPSFSANETLQKMQFHLHLPDKKDPFSEKQFELEAYINCYSMLQRLIYLKTRFNREGKIDLNHIVNLKRGQRSKTEKKADQNVLPYYKVTNEEDSTLLFESRFECGNLLCAYKVDDSNTSMARYHLLLENDTNTTGYIQWFFFRVTNTKRDRTVSINIINLLRTVSLYSRGLKIWCYSMKKEAEEGVGWHRAGKNVVYYLNNYYIYSNDKKRGLYTLSFEYEFQYDDDEVFFANSLPYSYTDLMTELNHFQAQEKRYPFFHRRTLCSTMGGNDMDMITINTCLNSSLVSYDERKGIILYARQHPGETGSSYVVKGAIDFLMGNSDEAKQLRELYIFKIIPMMNPDGVIEGNSRTSCAGCDLNRRWITPHEVIHPEIYHSKQMIHKMSAQRQIEFIIDFHGHCCAYNSFFYYNQKEDIKACSLFPYICSQISPMIDFSQCNFSMPKCKNGTARLELFRELDLNNIVTLETSFFGLFKEGLTGYYFNSKSFKEIGRSVCLGMLAYYYIENPTVEKQLSDFDVDFREYKAYLQRIQEEQKEEENGKEVDSDNSESEPSIDNFDQKKIMSLLPSKPRRRKKNNRKAKRILPKQSIQLSAKKLTKDLASLNTKTFDLKRFNASSSTKSISTPKLPQFHFNQLAITKLSPNTLGLSPEKSTKEVSSSRDQSVSKKVLFKMHWSYCVGDNPIPENRTLSQFVNSKIKEKISLKSKGLNYNLGLNNKVSSKKRKSQYPINVRDKTVRDHPFPKINV